MFTPLVSGFGGANNFLAKIKSDFVSIHSPPNPTGELLLTKIHKQAEDWLLNLLKRIF
jgi:histidinol-phosphate/aromatic aminotransferase/cobyric acid decarboxylase-like protein